MRSTNFRLLNNIIDIKPILDAENKPSVVITTHHKPDADALGSSLGLCLLLKQIGVNVTVITPTDYGDFLKWMPGESEVINFEFNQKKSQEIVNQASLVFCLDFNALKRINEFGEVVRLSSAKKVMIDHHLQPEGFEDYRLWSNLASSTCELIYWFAEELSYTHLVNKDVASCLYAGIMTDTAGFKHSSTTATTHRITAHLLEKGAESNTIFEAIYDHYSENRTRFIGFCLNEKLQLIKEYNTALICVTADELKRYHIMVGDSEGLVNYGLSIEGVRLSVLIVDRTVARKMSFRSKGEFPANEFARRFFNGGGHFSAAGGESKDPLEIVEAKFKDAITEYSILLSQ